MTLLIFWKNLKNFPSYRSLNFYQLIDNRVSSTKTDYLYVTISFILDIKTTKNNQKSYMKYLSTPNATESCLLKLLFQ